MGHFWQDFFSQKGIGHYLINIIVILIIYIIFRLVTRFVLHVLFLKVRSSKNKAIQMNPAISFFLSATKVILDIIFLLLVLPFLGVKTSSLLAFTGALGLGIGLGFQDFLLDIFSGIQLIITKFFQVGDRVRYQEIDGLVQAMNITHTILVMEDPQVSVYVPNRLLMKNAIVTYSQEAPKIVNIRCLVGIETPIQKIREILNPLFESYLSEEKATPRIEIESFQRGGMVVNCSVLCYNSVRNEEIISKVFETLQSNSFVPNTGVSLPQPERDNLP